MVQQRREKIPFLREGVGKLFALLELLPDEFGLGLHLPPQQDDPGQGGADDQGQASGQAQRVAGGPPGGGLHQNHVAGITEQQAEPLRLPTFVRLDQADPSDSHQASREQGGKTGAGHAGFRAGREDEGPVLQNQQRAGGSGHSLDQTRLHRYDDAIVSASKQNSFRCHLSRSR